MSWDVLLLKYAEVPTELPEEPPLPLGSRAAVHAAVRDTFPGTDWSDPAWGCFESEHGSIEFNLGDDDPADSMMLHVRADDAVVAGILELCAQAGWTAIDCSMGDLLAKAPTEGLQAWRAYRAQVIDQILED